MQANHDFSVIESLDLHPIKAKLMHKGGKGWSRARADAAEREYRRFLCLTKKFPNEHTAPLVDVDEFWHYHILDTRKYAADCEKAFGYFLHHFPYAGMRGKTDEEALQRLGERTRDLYEETFGEDYYANIAASDGRTATALSSGTRLSGAYGASAAKAPAYCFVTTVEPAYCFVTTAQTAYCFSTNEPAHRTSYQEEATARPAYCFVSTAPLAPEVAEARIVASEERLPENHIGFYLERPRLQI